MFETHNDLAPSIRSRMVELLNARLADAIDLRTQLKPAHWNVNGPQFIALHKLFDEIAADVDEYVDLVAERAVQLGGIADGTARQVAERSSLDEYSTTGGGHEHVHAVADVLASFGRLARAAIDIAADAKDQDTSDIFTEISRGTDKWLWMVEAHQQAGEWATGPRATRASSSATLSTDRRTPRSRPQSTRAIQFPCEGVLLGALDRMRSLNRSGPRDEWTHTLIDLLGAPRRVRSSVAPADARPRADEGCP